MLRHTFCHIPGVGRTTESRLWTHGFTTWDSVVAHAHLPLSPSASLRVRRHVKRSLAELDGGNSRFFYDSLPPEEQWRLFAEFRHSAAYLDIETTGVSGMDRITTIALYDGRDIRCYVRGRNLDEFKSDIRSYGLLVTYNGKCFDVPFIQRALGIRIDVAHIDLRYVLRSLGYSGGLKGCEKQIGIDRGDLEGLDGYFAVILWNDFIRNRNERALETLLAYNVEDVVNLEALMIHAYNRKLGATPFGLSGRYPLPTSPQIPFKPDAATINRLRRAFW